MFGSPVSPPTGVHEQYYEFAPRTPTGRAVLRVGVKPPSTPRPGRFLEKRVVPVSISRTHGIRTHSGHTRRRRGAAPCRRSAPGGQLVDGRRVSPPAVRNGGRADRRSGHGRLSRPIPEAWWQPVLVSCSLRPHAVRGDGREGLGATVDQAVQLDCDFTARWRSRCCGGKTVGPRAGAAEALGAQRGLHLAQPEWETFPSGGSRRSIHRIARPRNPSGRDSSGLATGSTRFESAGCRCGKRKIRGRAGDRWIR